MLMYDTIVASAFRRDVVQGLSAPQKALSSKYFYNAAGDELFQQIMACPEYYLSRAEGQLLRNYSAAIMRTCAEQLGEFDIVELGAGDGSKTVHLLHEALHQGSSRRYVPIDISASIVEYLHDTLAPQLGGLAIDGIVGEYLPALEQALADSPRPKLVLFLGATIGNLLPAEAWAFCWQLHNKLRPGDLLLVGFDLKKDPATILAAYNDQAGLTKAFNLNLLQRINEELGGNFNLEAFAHYPVYDPATGACKSYLISQRPQRVTFDDGTAFEFAQHEPIYMEVSQKYSLPEIDELGRAAGFVPVHTYFDAHRCFADVLWQRR
jgi:L-histidine N-alpha-methyltransferase